VSRGNLRACVLAAALVLLVEDAGRGVVLHREPVVPGSTFVVSYVHSSELVAVRGTFTVEPDRTLRVVETAFAGFGPGLPALEPGDDWRIEDGMIVHRPSAERLPDLTVRVLPITRHRLRLPSARDLDLSALIHPGGLARVRVE
jgi:hypothetical protein